MTITEKQSVYARSSCEAPKVSVGRSRRAASVSTLKFETVASLPRFSWAALFVPRQNTLRVLAGGDVVANGHVFWEGLSLSPRNPSAALNHPFPLSTGGTIKGGDIAFWTPGHFLDRLFVIRSTKGVVVSNSLPFCLRASGASLAARYLHYPWDFGRILGHRQTAPLDKGRLDIVANANLFVAPDGSVKVVPKPVPPSFDSYESYVRGLNDFLDEVRSENESLGSKAFRYLATLSTGYDSPAVSALARRIGLRDAVSVTNSRGGEPGDDSGEDIARALGLRIKTKNRDEYKKSGWEAERLFYAFGLPEDICLYPFRTDLAGCILFTGILGETQWDREPTYASGGWSWDPGGATLQELRLRTGFVQLPLAFYGWQHNASAIKISQSDALKPWSVGGDYDRPIARRLAEDAGVPRESFGMKKRAVSVMVGVHHHGYVDLDALGPSKAMVQRLHAHAQRVSGPRLHAEMTLNNTIHRLVRFGHESAHNMKAASDRHQARKSTGGGLGWNLMFKADRLLPLRRKYMAPFSSLNFSTQVANASLMADYASFDT